MKTWDDLEYWKSDDWYVMEDRLDGFDLNRTRYNPNRELVFNALDVCPLETVKVAVFGQDPYPDREYATGVAFSIPEKVKADDFPQTLRMIFKEYCDDLHYPDPTTGNLSSWTDQGVLLWNCYPTCAEGESLSHNYSEWGSLTRELVQVVYDRGGVVCCLGAVAREFAEAVKPGAPRIEAAHPSPRGNRFSKKPFLGSRIFSRINAELVRLNKPTIDWRLP